MSKKGVVKWFKVKKKGLRRFDYSPKQSASKRHSALIKAVKASSAIAVFRRLNAIANVTKRSQPVNSKKYLSDANYIKKKFYKTKFWKK